MQTRTCRTGRPSHYPVSCYVSLALPITTSVCLAPSVCLFVLLCLSICLSFNMFVLFCLSVCFFLSCCLSLSVCLDDSLYVCLALSVCWPGSVCHCVILPCLSIYLSGSISVLAWLCLSLCHLALSIYLFCLALSVIVYFGSVCL